MTAGPTFSVCIPNYNYARYLGETIESVLRQTWPHFEIVVADNASTDASLEIVERFKSDKIRVFRNRYNVGFAPNLDKATAPARNEHLIALSSDDLMHPEALATYARVLEGLGERRHRAVLTSAVDVIDADSRPTAVIHRPPGALSYRRLELAEAGRLDWAALPVESHAGHEALNHALRAKDPPAVFLATCFSRALYEEVEGYNSGYRMWPDTHFLYKLLSRDSTLVYVPERLFSYRVHANNQMANEARSSALKYQVDAYLHTLEFPDAVLGELGLGREDLVDVFVEKSVMERGLQAMAAGNRQRALQCLAMGFATYPKAAARQPKTYALAGLLALGPAGGWAAGQLYRLHQRRKPG